MSISQIIKNIISFFKNSKKFSKDSIKKIDNSVEEKDEIFTEDDNVKKDVISQEPTNETLSVAPIDDTLIISVPLEGFKNIKECSIETKVTKNHTYKIITGTITDKYRDDICPCCGRKMHINNINEVKIKHLSIGRECIILRVRRNQYYCEHCNLTKQDIIPFKATNHFITIQLENYIGDLLKTGRFTLVEISFLTGVNRNIIKAIDKKNLIARYTKNGDGKELIKPEKFAKYLGIDEFKLHDGNKYATHIIDIETGHILWIAKGKKKQVVYDFIKHVGEDWMKHVIAVACDMNSDFEEAFRDMCPHIEIVFDHFHIVKNLNEKVISEVRKDEEKRLKNEGLIEEAKMFKKTKYLLCSNKDTLAKKDNEVAEGKILNKGSELFKIDLIKRHGNYQEKYQEILEKNEIFFVIDLIKEHLKLAYSVETKKEMIFHINEIINLCDKSQNIHLLKFKKLITNHYEGIVAYADHKISAGKIEGINNKIKTIRRQAYGFNDDEYFFLKLMEVSRYDKTKLY